MTKGHYFIKHVQNTTNITKLIELMHALLGGSIFLRDHHKKKTRVNVQSSSSKILGF